MVSDEGKNTQSKSSKLYWGFVVVAALLAAFMLFSLTIYQSQEKRINKQQQQLDELYNITIMINNGLTGLNTKIDWIQNQRFNDFFLQNNITEINSDIPKCLVFQTDIILWVDKNKWIAQYSNGSFYYYANNTFECKERTDISPSGLMPKTIRCNDICPEVKPII